MCYLGVEHIENTFGTLPKKTSSPLHLRPKRKNWAPRECMLSLLIGCMNFFNCQKWLWPFSTRANSLIGRRIPLIADSSIFSPIIKGWYLLGSLLERTPASFHEGGMGGRTRTHPGVPFWSSSFQEHERERTRGALTPPRSWTFYGSANALWWWSVCLHVSFLGMHGFVFCSRSLSSVSLYCGKEAIGENKHPWPLFNNSTTQEAGFWK